MSGAPPPPDFSTAPGRGSGVRAAPPPDQDDCGRVLPLTDPAVVDQLTERGASGKVVRLAAAARAGLQVPAGVVLPAELVAARTPRHLAEATRAALRSRRATHGRTRRRGQDAPPLAVPRVAVRSAFSGEDGATTSRAGAFTSHLDVAVDDADALSDAVAAVLASAERHEPAPARRDVLVLAMVPAARAGVAFTQASFQDDLVDHTAGLGDRLLGGAVTGVREQLAVRVRGERTAAGWRGRLQALLRDVRRVFGPGDWDVEWADDGTRCWLLQVRPITAPPRRDEALTLANHREILPDLPSRLTTATLAAAAGELFGYWRRFDPNLPADRPFVEVVLWRPVINLSLLTDTMRILGLPTAFVTRSMGGQHELEVPAAPLRLLVKSPRLLAMGLDQLRAVGHGRATAQRLHTLAATPGDDLVTVADTLRRCTVELITGMFALSTAISGPLAVLDALGVAGVLHTRQRTAATRLWEELDQLRERVAQRPAAADALRAGHVRTGDSEVDAALTALLSRHGHRGIYESDVARPRYAEDPAPLLEAVVHGRALASPPALPLCARLAWPLWWQASRAMGAREDLRSEAMKAFGVVRRRLLELAGQHAAAGHLPEAAAVFDLDLDELAALDAGVACTTTALAERRAELDRLGGYRLPDLLHRSDDVESYRPGAHADRGTAELTGLGLTGGAVTGTVWVADEPGPPPDELADVPVVLVTRGVDAGWLATFSRVAAVIVETGGELSHGSILLRESGTPAVTNVTGATGALATGDHVEVRAGAGVVLRHATSSG